MKIKTLFLVSNCMLSVSMLFGVQDDTQNKYSSASSEIYSDKQIKQQRVNTLAREIRDDQNSRGLAAILLNQQINIERLSNQSQTKNRLLTNKELMERAYTALQVDFNQQNKAYKLQKQAQLRQVNEALNKKH